MTRKNLSEYRRKYNTFRHHAWAGLGFLSVLLVIRIIVPTISEIILPILTVIIIYIVISLIFTYRYRAGINVEEKVIQVQTSESIEKEKILSEVEIERLKIEKKKIKTNAKKTKKEHKSKEKNLKN